LADVSEFVTILYMVSTVLRRATVMEVTPENATRSRANVFVSMGKLSLQKQGLENGEVQQWKLLNTFRHDFYCEIKSS
jgi:hypothetical protein